MSDVAFHPDFRDKNHDFPEGYNDLPEAERFRISSERTRLLHIIAQSQWHSSAFIVGNRNGLIVLRDAIDEAIRQGSAEANAMVSDGEGYGIEITMENKPWEHEAWQHVAMPYTDPVAAGEPDPSWDVTLLRNALHKANAELVKRAVKPIPDPTA
jgi:hypothetical protein